VAITLSQYYGRYKFPMHVHPTNDIAYSPLVSGQIKKSFPDKLSLYNVKAAKTAKSLMNGNYAMDGGR
jgi:hypothetical protein